MAREDKRREREWRVCVWHTEAAAEDLGQAGTLGAIEGDCTAQTNRSHIECRGAAMRYQL